MESIMNAPALCRLTRVFDYGIRASSNFAWANPLQIESKIDMELRQLEKCRRRRCSRTALFFREDSRCHGDFTPRGVSWWKRGDHFCDIMTVRMPAHGFYALRESIPSCA